jgi:uncharacterized protein (TIGR03435 family)
MMLIHAVLPALTSLAAFGQSTAAQFEVASIRPSAQTSPERMSVGIHIDGARFNCVWFSLKDYIRAAYQLKIYQVTGPDWIGGERFDINAKLPSGSTEDQVPDMLKALLIERFQMKSHMETKDFPVYALVLAKGGLKMRQVPEDPDDPADPNDKGHKPVNVSGSGGRGGVHIDYGHGSFFTLADNKLIGRKLTMAQFGELMARFEDKPVVDMTGIKGSYDFDLDFTPEDYMAMLIRSAISAGVVMPPQALRMISGSSGDSLLNALEKLGLKLESRKAPLEMLVVDHIAKAPTEN